MANQHTLPNLFILGAAKAGTTALCDLLKQHPNVYVPFSKEPFFFNSEEYYALGLEWYSSTYYSTASSYKYRCDATPHYLYWSSKVAPRIKHTCPVPPKMIVVLRDPVDRAYSWYWNMVREGKEELLFEEALKAEEERLLDNQEELYRLGSMTFGYQRGSCYASQLGPFLELFPRESFCFILTEELRQNPEQTMQTIFRFLDLEPQQVLSQESNPSALPRSVTLQRWLRKKTSWRDMLKPLIPLRVRHAMKQKLIQMNMRRSQYPEMAPATESALRAHFTPEVSALEELIDRDLSAWKA